MERFYIKQIIKMREKGFSRVVFLSFYLSGEGERF
jgi:hypothetical protein